MAIPKNLHYVWLGGSEYPPVIRKCIESWKKYLSDYKFIKWDESNFDVNFNRYVSEAYKSKKYAFVSDYIRLKALYDCGGVYLDTDCRVKKSFNDLISLSAFTGFGGDNREIAAHALAFEKGSPFIKECLDSYENERFITAEGGFNDKTVNERMTEILEKHGFIRNGKEQTIFGVKIFPMTYFCPISYSPDVKDCKSKKTYCVHIWSDKEVKREKCFLIKLGRKLKLDKLKRKILNRSGEKK